MNKQAKWREPLIIELSGSGRCAMDFPVPLDEDIEIPKSLIREKPPALPEVSQPELVRHYIRLSQMNFSVDTGMYPLGSCTMKYNPKINEEISMLPEITDIHPHQPEETIQGLLEIFYLTQKWLAEISGMDAVSLQPPAGASGEFTGMRIIKKYFEYLGQKQRNEIIVADSAHGTNPASAAMAGLKVIEIPSDESGCIDIYALKETVSYKTAGLMLTNPNTLGIFEQNIEDIVDIIHDAGGLCYYDGANLNAIMGIVKPGDMGFDIIHFNLHKTFSTPHGGGGPGSGPVGVKSFLSKFLPVPVVEKKDSYYHLNYDIPETIGKVKSFFGNTGVIIKAFTYIVQMGKTGLKKASEFAVINANYLSQLLKDTPGLQLPYRPDIPRKHEAVFSADKMKHETGIDAIDIAKRILDFGIHAPTINFPIIVSNALMIEPTESETMENIDYYVDVIKKIAKEAYTTPDKVKNAPHNTASSRIDEVNAARNPVLTWKQIKS